MAKIQSGRSNVTDFIVGTPGFLGSAEQNIANIFGIPIDQEITGRIFETGDGTSGVNTTGTIRGFLWFASTNLATEIGNTSGIAFENEGSNTVYKIANVGDGLMLYSGDLGSTPVAWTEVLSLNNVADNFLALSDVKETTYEDMKGLYVRVNDDEDGLEFGGEVTAQIALTDLSDVPPYDGESYSFLKTNVDGTALSWVESASAGGTLDELTDVDLENLSSAYADKLEYVQYDGSNKRWENVPQIWAQGEWVSADIQLLSDGGWEPIMIIPKTGAPATTSTLWNMGDRSTNYGAGFTPNRGGIYRLTYYFYLENFSHYWCEFKLVTSSELFTFPTQYQVSGGLGGGPMFAELWPAKTKDNTGAETTKASVRHIETTVFVEHSGAEPILNLSEPSAVLYARWNVQNSTGLANTIVHIREPRALAVRLG